MKQTAVEWLIEKMLDSGIGICKEWREQAKEMEKENTMAFGYRCIGEVDSELGDLVYKKVPEEVYNETYGSKGSDGNFKQFSLYEHKETITSADTKVSQTFLDHVPDVRKMVEISDEDIYKEAEHKSKIFRGWTTYETSAFIMACQWYREQLKKKI